MTIYSPFEDILHLSNAAIFPPGQYISICTSCLGILCEWFNAEVIFDLEFQGHSKSKSCNKTYFNTGNEKIHDFRFVAYMPWKMKEGLTILECCYNFLLRLIQAQVIITI